MMSSEMYSWSWDFRALWGNRVSTTFFSLALSVNLPMKGKENDTHTLAQNHRELHNHFEKKNHCHPSFFPFFPHQQSWRQSLLKVSRSMGEVASQPGRVGHGRRNWWGNFSVSVTIQGNATVCLFSSVFRFCTGFRIFLAWFIVDVHQPWLLPHLILGETKTALRERFYSRVQVQYKLHTLSLFMDYNLFNHEYREMYIKDKPMDGHVTLFNSTWSLLLYYPPPPSSFSQPPWWLFYVSVSRSPIPQSLPVLMTSTLLSHSPAHMFLLLWSSSLQMI